MSRSPILVLCLLLATPLPAAAESTAPTVGYASVDVLNPEFTLGGEIRVEFGYAAWCSGDCAGSEWRVFLGSTWSSGEVPDAELPADVARGAIPFVSESGYQYNDVATVFSAAGLAPGYQPLRVATRASGADTWHVAWGGGVEVLDPTDWDYDGIPQSLEWRLCGDHVASLSMTALPDACFGTYEMHLDGRSLVLDIPRHVWTYDEHDYEDHDGYLNAVTIEMTRVYLVPGTAPADMVQPGERHVVAIDVVPDRRSRALEQCARIPVVTAFAWSADADGDGWPERGSFALGRVCDDARHDHAPRLAPTTDVFSTRIDPHDGDPEIAPEAPYEAFYQGVHAAFGPDADADGVPLSSTVKYAIVTFDPARFPAMDATYDAYEVGLDPADDVRDLPVPFSPLDHDGDLVPEHAEPYLCAWDDPFTPEDGTCGPEGRFTPPVGFTSRLEAPLLLADDDLDLLPDGAEAAACDAAARVGWTAPPCAGYDVQWLPW